MNLTPLEKIAIKQAKALKSTFELLEVEGLSDSEMRALIGSMERWIDHINPKKWKISA
jgi:hypothetical protein